MKKASKVVPRKPLVCILMGSKTDMDRMRKAAEVLETFSISYEMKVLSAHRVPAQVASYVKQAEARGTEVFIAGAGMAAHLAGAVAANTTRPVIGVPLGAALLGLDALLATVQMPPGIPVATVAVDGMKNAGILAAQILSIKNPALKNKLKNEREKTKNEILNIPPVHKL